MSLSETTVTPTKRIKLLPHQYDTLESKEKFLALIGGIGSGKSFTGASWKFMRCLQYPKALHFIGANTYGQLRDSTLAAMFQFLSDQGVPYDFNQQAGLLQFCGAKVLCKSMDNFDVIRGIEIADFWLDEVRDLKLEAFNMMMGRLRDRRADNRQGLVTSSPAGFNWIYDYFHANGEKHTPEFKLIHASSFNNPHLPKGYIDSIKSQYSPEFFKQEIMGEFVNIYQGQAYINFGNHNLRTDNPFWADGLVHPQLPIVVAPDFNLNPMAWGLGQKRINQFFWLDEIRLPNSHTQEASKVLVEKLVDIHPHIHRVGVIICGDATAKAGQRAAAGQSDYDILCQALDAAKIPWQNKTPESNPAIRDRINTMNAAFKDANGETHTWIHPTRCPFMVKDFWRVCWKPGGNLVLDQTTDPDLTHSSDGPGYAQSALAPLQYKRHTTTMKVIMR